MVLKRIYLDSNVFIAYIKAEIGKGFKPMGCDAEWLFKRAKGKVIFVISDYVLKEIKKLTFYEEAEVMKVFGSFGIKIELFFPNKSAFELETKFGAGGIHYPDSMHAALAVAGSCEAIVTFNKKDFPEELIGINVFEPGEIQL